MSNSLGYALAELANGTRIIEIDTSATGGFGQWCAARMRDARADYHKLAGGCLDREAARRRWMKVEAFVNAHFWRMCEAEGDDFAYDVEGLVSRINNAFFRNGDPEFNPLCPHCRQDFVLDEAAHFCNGGSEPIDEPEDDLDDEDDDLYGYFDDEDDMFDTRYGL